MSAADYLEPSLRRLLTEAVAQVEADRRAREEMRNDSAEGMKRRQAADAVLADLVRVCQCCAAKSSQRPLVKADNKGALLCLQCYHELTGKHYEPPKPVPKPKSFGNWS